MGWQSYVARVAVEEYTRRVFESHVGPTAGASPDHSCLYVEPAPSDTASADLDWRGAWELAAPVVVAARRFTLAEAEGNEALVEDSHFQLLRALTDYFAGGPPGESPIESVRRHLGH